MSQADKRVIASSENQSIFYGPFAAVVLVTAQLFF